MTGKKPSEDVALLRSDLAVIIQGVAVLIEKVDALSVEIEAIKRMAVLAAVDIKTKGVKIRLWGA